MPKTTDTPSNAKHKGDFATQRRACVEETLPARPACREADRTDGADLLRAQPDPLPQLTTEDRHPGLGSHQSRTLTGSLDPGPSQSDDNSEIPAPNMRTFTLNSREFYEAVCPPPEPHMWGPGLPSEPWAERT